MTSPRAADDFATIRARLKELRRERADALPEGGDRTEMDPRPHPGGRSRETEPEDHHLPHPVRQRRFG
jgi:hypothetical protein